MKWSSRFSHQVVCSSPAQRSAPWTRGGPADSDLLDSPAGSKGGMNMMLTIQSSFNYTHGVRASNGIGINVGINKFHILLEK